MRIKQGVRIQKLTPQALVILLVAQQLRPDLRLTAGDDGVHKPGSKHYEGNAVDLGTRGYTRDENAKFAADLAFALGENYDVVLEADHVHAEYDPK